MKRTAAMIMAIVIMFCVSVIAASAKEGDVITLDGKKIANYVGEYVTETLESSTNELVLSHPVYLTIGEDIQESVIDFEDEEGKADDFYYISLDPTWISHTTINSSGATEVIKPEDLSSQGKVDKSEAFIYNKNKADLLKAGEKTVRFNYIIETNDGASMEGTACLFEYKVTVITKEEADKIKNKQSETMDTSEQSKATPDETSDNSNSGDKNYDSTNNANGSIPTGESSYMYAILITLCVISLAVIHCFIKRRDRD